MSDQLRFDGIEIQSDYISVAGVELPLVRIKDDLDVHVDDEFEVRMRFRVDFPRFKAKRDKRGMRTGETSRRFEASPVEHSLAVTQYRGRDELEAEWRTEHGAAS